MLECVQVSSRHNLNSSGGELGQSRSRGSPEPPLGPPPPEPPLGGSSLETKRSPEFSRGLPEVSRWLPSPSPREKGSTGSSRGSQDTGGLPGGVDDPRPFRERNDLRGSQEIRGSESSHGRDTVTGDFHRPRSADGVRRNKESPEHIYQVNFTEHIAIFPKSY